MQAVDTKIDKKIDKKIEKRLDARTAAKLPHLITALPGPQAKALVARDHAVLSPSYTRDYPLVAKSGRGAMVEDVDGNIFLDFAAGIAVVSTGHCHPEVVAAIQKQAAELIHMSGTDFYYPNLVVLAERLAALAPGKEAKRVYFGNSGTEATEAAIKLARYHTKRDKLIAFYGSFHGRTMGALSLTASKAVQRKHFGPLLAGVFHAHYPNSYRGTFGNRSPSPEPHRSPPGARPIPGTARAITASLGRTATTPCRSTPPAPTARRSPSPRRCKASSARSMSARTRRWSRSAARAIRSARSNRSTAAPIAWRNCCTATPPAGSRIGAPS